GDCQRRAVTNPLRVLDCKVPSDQALIDKLPSILDHLCDACRTHFAAVRRHLDEGGIAYTVRPRMVRGLDYYMRTTFEVVHGALGAQSSVLGGGRYDSLAAELEPGMYAPGIGFSIGEDRLVMSVEAAQEEAAQKHLPLKLFIVPVGNSPEVLNKAAEFARIIRKYGKPVEVAFGSHFVRGVIARRLGRMLELANKLEAEYALIIGEDEVKNGLYALKNMKTGQQEPLTKDAITAKMSA